MTTSQTTHAAALVAVMHTVNERALDIERGTEPSLLARQPADGGWSAAQVFEHLCVANDSYLIALRRLLPDGTASARAGANPAPWRASFAGKLLVRSMESPRKVPAPTMWRPTVTPRANVIGEFLERQREIEQLIERSTAFEWQRMRLSSPVSRLIRMNVGDAFTLLVRHEERHFRQIDRVLASFDASVPERTVSVR
jgi:hypothetical protein